MEKNLYIFMQCKINSDSLRSSHCFLTIGCRVMIASRKEEVLKNAAEELRAVIPDSSPAKLEWMTCNIRKEEQVLILHFFNSHKC